jgi:hypothetical protein
MPGSKERISPYPTTIYISLSACPRCTSAKFRLRCESALDIKTVRVRSAALECEPEGGLTPGSAWRRVAPSARRSTASRTRGGPDARGFAPKSNDLRNGVHPHRHPPPRCKVLLAQLLAARASRAGRLVHDFCSFTWNLLPFHSN